MNENIDLTEILKNCPKGTKFYCTICGYVTIKIRELGCINPIAVYGRYSGFDSPSLLCKLSKYGRYSEKLDGECILFPSKEQRDWSKFSAPWYKKEKFDPNTLKPFDRVLARDSNVGYWRATLYSHKKGDEEGLYPYATSNSAYMRCIPYNDETKHLVGTTKEAPEFYRYWED